MLPTDQPPRYSAVLYTTTYTFPNGQQIVYKQGRSVWHLAYLRARQLQVVGGMQALGVTLPAMSVRNKGEPGNRNNGMSQGASSAVCD